MRVAQPGKDKEKYWFGLPSDDLDELVRTGDDFFLLFICQSIGQVVVMPRDELVESLTAGFKAVNGKYDFNFRRLGGTSIYYWTGPERYISDFVEHYQLIRDSVSR